VAAGGEVTLELTGQRVAASMPDTLTLELEVEENELEIELKWVTTAPTPPGSAPASEPAGTTATGQAGDAGVTTAPTPPGSAPASEPAGTTASGQAGDAAPQPPSSAGQAPAW
jgi:hypothetical protein